MTVSLFDNSCDCVQVIDADTDAVVTILIPGPAGPSGSDGPSKTITADYTLTVNDGTILVSSSSNVNVTLEDPTTVPNKTHDIINGYGGGTVTIIGTLGINVNPIINRPGDSVSIKSIEGTWYIY